MTSSNESPISGQPLLFEDAVAVCKRKRILMLLLGGFGAFLASGIVYLALYVVLYGLMLRRMGSSGIVHWGPFGLILLLILSYPAFRWEPPHPAEIGSESRYSHWDHRVSTAVAAFDFLFFGSRLFYCGIDLWIDAIKLKCTRPDAYLPILDALYHEPHRIELNDLEQALGVSRDEFLPLLKRFDAVILLQRPPAVALTSAFRERLDRLTQGF